MPVQFSLNGIQFRFRVPSGGPGLRLPDEYAQFLVPPGQDPPEALYHVAPRGDSGAVVGSGAILWENELWRLRGAGANDYDIEVHDGLPRAWRRVANVRRDFSTGRLQPAPQDGRDDALFPFHNPQDRTLVLGRLCHLGGAMIHGSCVLVEGRALLFVGMSGAGKTTIARLWRSHGAMILNDERNLIRPCGGSILAGASPWHGEENQVNRATAPLAAVFCLKQSTENSLQPLTVSDSLSRLMTTAFVPVFLPDGPARTLNALGAILERVPAYELSFTPDKRALDLCRSAIGV